MKKKFFSTASLILLAAAVTVFAAGCGANADNDPEASSGQATVPAVQNEQQAPAVQPGNEAVSSELKSWTMDASAWSDGNGATVTFTATPASYAEGLRAALSIRIGSLEAESTNCNWDGTAFTGSVELSAIDGYGYYCILIAPDGTRQEIELNSPEKITNEDLVFLGSSLTAYANLMVEDWEATASALTIKSGYIQCQVPRLNAGNADAAISDASLVLKLNDTELSRTPLDIPAGEGEGSFEMPLVNQTFTVPALEEEHQLNLWLEITLSNASTVSASGGSWYSSNGQLQMVAG